MPKPSLDSRRMNPAYTWLTPLYLTLGLVTLMLQWRLLRTCFKQALGPAIRHYLASAIALFITSAILGAALSIPLRLTLE